VERSTSAPPSPLLVGLGEPAGADPVRSVPAIPTPPVIDTTHGDRSRDWTSGRVASTPLTVTVEVDHGIGRLTVVGEVDLSNHARLREAATRALDQGASTLELDSSGLEFIDSSGLGTLVGMAIDAQHAGGGLTIVHAPAMLVRLLDVTGLRPMLCTV
jgi:anti-sigma B factor antagonist